VLPMAKEAKTKYGGTEGADVEAAAFSKIGASVGVTPASADASKKPPPHNPWTSPTAVIAVITLCVTLYVAWVYGAFSFPGQQKPEPSFTPAAVEAVPAVPSPAPPARATGNIALDMASGVTNVPFNMPEIVDFPVHDTNDPNDGYGPAAPAESINGFDASGEETEVFELSEYEIEHENDEQASFEAAVGSKTATPVVQQMPKDFVLASLGAAQERVY
jgi:hypothetical protein